MSPVGRQPEVYPRNVGMIVRLAACYGLPDVGLVVTLPGETVGTGAPNPCPECGWLSDLSVLQSPAGYYLGHVCRCGPSIGQEAAYSRESVRYWPTRDEALSVLATGHWEERTA